MKIKRKRSRTLIPFLAGSALTLLLPQLYAPIEPNCGGDYVDFPCDECPAECPVGAGAGGANGSGRVGSISGCQICPSGGKAGMAQWRVSEPYCNLWIDDEPLGYQPSHGPRVSFKLSYKQRAATTGNDVYTYSLGPAWHFSWQSILLPRGSEDDAVHFAGGGTRFMTNGTVDYYSGKRLTRVGSPVTSYELESPDGAKDVYGLITTNLVGVVQAFVTECRDAQGQALTFQYDPIDPDIGVVRLRYVIDADNRTNTIYYTDSHPWYSNRISQVVDPFGRTTTLAYDTDTNSVNCGLLTNITDVAGISSGFTYDDGRSITNLVTPYGTTSFKLTRGGYGSGGRAVQITEANGSKQLYVTKDYASGVASSYGDVPDTSPFSNTFDNSGLDERNSFHWNRQQFQALSGAYRSSEDIADLTSTDFLLARMQHWLKGNWDTFGRTVSLERMPSPDGTTAGQKTWYDYAGKPATDHEGTQILPLFTAQVLPDTSPWYDRTVRNDHGHVTTQVGTYTKTDGSVGLRTNTFTYAANNIDLTKQIGPNNEQVVSNYFATSYHQPDASYDALNQETLYQYNGNRQVISVRPPSGLTTTNIYFSSGSYPNWLDKAIDLEIQRTNAYTYASGLVYSHTDERGLTTTNFWDNLQRLTGVQYPDGTTRSNRYTALDLTSAKDRLGNWSYFGYNAIRQKITETNANNVVTRFGYCDCGQLESITNAWGTSVEMVTRFGYDYQGQRTFTYYPDATITNWFDALGRVAATADAWATNWFGYNNQSLLTSITNAYGAQQRTVFDIEDQPIWVTDANNVTITNTYDDLRRLRTRTAPDGGVEAFGYSARGLTAYTNQLNATNFYVYDEAGRKTFETNANNELIRYTNGAAGDLLALVDGKGQVTKWNYDEFGRVTNKLDQAGVEILRYKYDPDNRLTNRWSKAKGDTKYTYDPVGNLTNIDYAVSTDVRFEYDALNRATKMVDAAGTTLYGYAAAGQLWTEDGPWASDTVTNTYNNRLRTALSLAQPTGKWTNAFNYDGAKRLTNVTSQAGAFDYYLGATAAASPLAKKIVLGNTSYITNIYDSVARLLGTYLKTSGNVLTNRHEYGYNAANQRINSTNMAGTYYTNTYDLIGQLKIADSSVNSEDRGYQYDAAWNLNWLTNNGSAYAFQVDSRNQLTNAYGGTNGFDGNGNLVSGTNGHNIYVYDDENRLIQWFSYLFNSNSLSGGDLRTDFTYDGLGRLRVRQEYSYNFGGNGPAGPGLDRVLEAGSWQLLSTTRYVYDGWRVIQERDGNNTPPVSYTRGTDLSGSLEGAGGIGGLLARSHGYSSGTGNWSTHNCYHADGNGNVTYMLNSSQSKVAEYRYDPFGNTISSSGTLASANVYRFSSKEIHVNSGLYYYGYRFYSPSLQRWPNRDPLGELGFERTHGNIAFIVVKNAYAFVENDPVSSVDPLGLQRHIFEIIFPPSSGGDNESCKLISRTEPITGDPKPGKGNHNGQTACIWRCNQYGDRPAAGPPYTRVTFAKPNKPCPPPEGACDVTNKRLNKSEEDYFRDPVYE